MIVFLTAKKNLSTVLANKLVREELVRNIGDNGQLGGVKPNH